MSRRFKVSGRGPYLASMWTSSTRIASARRLAGSFDGVGKLLGHVSPIQPFMWPLLAQLVIEVTVLL